jgi:predicted alpha/beta-fold hydrolase
MLPSMFRKVNGVNYQRERVDTPDRDFLDLDWLANRNDKAVIVFHGLEGSSQRHYVQGTARTFSTAGWDVVAVNSRSCSGELNLAPRLYHHADTDDVRFIIDHVLKTKSYQQLALVGFSMGGAMILNYLGEAGQEVPEVVKSAIAFSSPVNVGDSARELEKRGREFYLNRFLKKLKRKIKAKASQHPGLLDTEGLDGLKSFLQYDDRYTAPMHGFADAEEFYHRASSYYKIKDIAIPTLLATAANDPFMPSSCYPYEEARAHQRFYLEVPRYGGHVGFPLKSLKHSWMEARALEFAMEHTM